MENSNTKPIINVGRNLIIKNWKEKNIYDDNELDMVGMSLDNKNAISVHHIFGRGENNQGLAVIGRLFHDYIDSYLLPNDTNEYVKWNNYFAKLYQYSISNKKAKNKDKLIKECNILLCNILKNKAEKAQKFIHKLRPYLNMRIATLIVESFESTKFSENEFVPKSMLIDRKKLNRKYRQMLHISKDDTKETFLRYCHRKLKSYFTTECGTINVIYKSKPSSLDELLHKEQITKDNWNDRTKQKIRDKSVPKRDWMGSIAYPNEIVDEDLFLTRINREILYYLENNNQKLYVHWMNLFSVCRENCSKSKKLDNKVLSLRKKTFDYIGDVFTQPGKTAIRNRILKAYNEMTDAEKKDAYHETDRKNQLAIALVLLSNDVHRDTLKKKEIEEKLNNKPVEFKININNIDSNLNNDEMGNDFHFDIHKEEQPKDPNFLSKDSYDTLKLIRNNSTLLSLWLRYLEYINKVRHRDATFFESDRKRYNTLFKIHKELMRLRRLTRDYFITKINLTNNPSEKERYQYMVNVYRSKRIRFAISNQLNFYDSKQFEKPYEDYLLKKQAKKKRVDTEAEELKKKMHGISQDIISCENYNELVRDSYDRKIKELYIQADNYILGSKFEVPTETESVNEENLVNLNRDVEFNKMLSNHCKKDSMGLFMGPTTSEHMDVVGLLGIDVFLNEQSYHILKFLKEKYPDAFIKWILLLNKKVNNLISNEDYESELFTILCETYHILRTNYKNFDGILKTASIRVAKAKAYYRGRAREKE